LTSGNAANQTAPSAKRQRNFPARRLRARAGALPLDAAPRRRHSTRAMSETGHTSVPSRSPALRSLNSLIFLSRWLQAPLYLGLIVAQGVYVYHFLTELWHLVLKTTTIQETEIMLMVLGLIDVVMIANLLIMVIVGGYETFVSRLHLEGHPDQPEWLSHVNAGVLKVKLAMALIGISSIHLLKSFINIEKLPGNVVLWQVIIHLTFVVSALLLAWIDRLVTPPKTEH
jgi:uncharacterized protein (TIGR00645 family)